MTWVLLRRTFIWLLALSLVAVEPVEPGERLDADSTESSSLFRRVRSPHERVVEFVHRVKNQGKSPLRQVQVAVAVPRSDDRQRIRSLRFHPKPERISRDGWDQETAHFLVDRIGPGDSTEIRLEVHATLFDSEWLLVERDVGPAHEVPERIVRHYLRNAENYKLDEAIVRRAAERLRTTEASVLERVRRIHDFVIDSVDYSRDERWDPADSVLRKGSGSCSEYSYLMIALCRLNGIPARYAGGTWFEKDGVSPPRGEAAKAEASVDRVFHRWVEVYLPRVGWFPVDPTQDDAADKEGETYRYFGRLPWSYLSMNHSDGDRLESGPLGWDYRSDTRWLRRPDVAQDSVLVERFAVWKTPCKERKVSEAQRAGTSRKSGDFDRS